MKATLYFGLFLAILTTGCGSGGGSQSNNTSTATVSSIQIVPGSVSIGTGANQEFTATAQLSDGSTKNVTNSVQWSSSDTSIASVNAGGVATGVAPGTVTITATSRSVHSMATLQVTGAAANLVSLAIFPAASSVPVNTSQQFTAIGTYADGSSSDLSNLVTWSSSSTVTATVTTRGVVTALAAGTTNISAILAHVSQSTSLTVTAPSIVSVAVTPVGLTLGIGINQQYTATATYSDGTSYDLASGVTWSSSSTSVANVNGSGLVTTAGSGSTTIMATVGSFSDTATLTVVPAHLISISVAPATPSIALGTSQQFSAVGSFDDGSTQLLPFVSWMSSSTSVAIVDSNGLATGVGTGTVTITATSGSVSGTASLTITSAALVSIAVTPANFTMSVGTTRQFVATGTFSDSSTQDISVSVTWTSSNVSAASINGSGLVSSVASGSTTIKGAFGSISGSTGLTVSTAHLVSITIIPADARIFQGTSVKLTATGTFSDGSMSTNLSGISWKSSKPSVVSVRRFGRADGKKSGVVTITASSSGVSGTTTLTVGTGTLVSIAITPLAPTDAVGGTQQFTATGTFSDGTTQDVTLNSHWSSSSPGVSTIQNAPSAAPGLAQCLAAGTSTIGANSGGITGSTVLTLQ